MAGPRSTWKGMLKISKLSLVAIPVRLYSPEESGSRISFHQYHTCDAAKPETGSRVQSPKWCPVCARVVPTGEVHRGYEYEKGKHVVVTDDDLEQVASASSGCLEIDTVTDEPVDPLHVDDTLICVPEGVDDGVHRAFRTIVEGLGSRVAVGTIVMRDRTYRMALQRFVDGDLVALVAYKLRADAQVRGLSSVMASVSTSLDPEEVMLARALLDHMTGSFQYSEVRDEYTESLQALIAAKVAGNVAPVPQKTTIRVNVMSLADQLRQAVKVVSVSKALPVKAPQVKATASPVARAKRKKA